MLTVKYLQEGGSEVIAEYEGITAEIIDGCRVVHAHNQTEMTTFGPIKRAAGSPIDPVVPTIYVMNRFGATVATYRL